MRNLKEKFNNHDAVSFDLFDTLILRLVKDRHDIYDYVGEKFNLSNFREERIKAEIKATNENGGFGGLNISDIYKELSNKYDDYLEMIEYELKTEKSLFVINKEMFEYYSYFKKQNKKIIITSDTYYQEDFLTEILANFNIEYDELLLSSELNSSKKQGSIYRLLKKIDTNIIHIGDNYYSDFLMCKKNGIDAYHYKKSIEQEKYYYNFGYNDFGPLFSGFYKFVEEHITKQKSTVLFIARDGYLLNETYKRINNSHNNVYAKLSRKVLSIAACESAEEFVNYISANDGFTFNQLFDLYEMNYKVDNDKTVEGNEIELIKILNSSDEFNIKKNSEKTKVINYLSSICDLENDIVIVDVGWKGSTQKFIEKILKSINYRHTVKGLYFGIMNSEKIFKGEYYCFQFDNIRGTGKDFEWLNSIAILEIILSAPHSTVVDVDEKILADYSNYPELKDIHDGIRDFMSDKYMDINKYENIDYTSRYLEVIIHPDKQDVNNLGNLKQSDSAGDYLRKKVIETDEFKKNILNFNLDKLILNTFWPIGQIKALTGFNFFDKIIYQLIKSYAGRKNGRK